MATHFSILDWEIPWTEEPSGLQSMGSKTNCTQLSTHTHTHTHPSIHVMYFFRWMASSGLTCKYTHCLLFSVKIQMPDQCCVSKAHNSTVPALDTLCLCLQQREKYEL